MYIFCWRALASYRRRPLSSNVRHHKSGLRCVNGISGAERRAPNSHDAAKERIPAQRGAVARNGQAVKEDQQPDFSQGRRERRPVQSHDDAARGDERM